jgi:hypothetical protein
MLKNYLLAIPSTLALPGPHSSNVRNPAKNNAAVSPVSKKSILWTLNRAIDILITNGIDTSLVNKPIVINKAQKNSAKMDKTRDDVEPMPIRS